MPLLSKHQFDWLRAVLEDDWQDFLKGAGSLTNEKKPTIADLEILQVFVKFKLVSSGSTLDEEGYLVGESEMKERVRDVTRALRSPERHP